MRRLISKVCKYNFSGGKQSIIPVDIQLQIRKAQKLEQLQIKHATLQQTIDEKIKFPYKIYGTADEYQQNFSYMAFRIMQYYGVDPKILSQYFLKIFKGTLYSLQAKDQMFLNEYVEPNLKNLLLSSIEELKTKNMSIKIQQNHSVTHGGVLMDQAQILQNALIRGLSVNRQQNMPAQNYIKYNDDDESIFTIFTPKYVSQPQKFINPQTNKTVYDDYSRLMIMRSFVRIKTPTTLIIPQIQVQKNMFTNEHLLIFQNAMIPPKIFKSGYKLQGYMQWLMKWRFGCWRLVDLDNCMLGNPLLKNNLKKDYNQPIFKGSKLDRQATISVRNPQR